MPKRNNIAKRFDAKMVNGMHVTDGDLRSAGIVSSGDRENIINALKDLELGSSSDSNDQGVGESEAEMHHAAGVKSFVVNEKLFNSLQVAEASRWRSRRSRHWAAA